MDSIHLKRYFLWFSAAFLAFSALTKLLTLLDGGPLLGAVDPVWGLRNGLVFCISSAVEVVACALVAAFPNSRICTAVIATLGAEFVLYHLFVLGMGMRSACPCLGGLSSWIQTLAGHGGWSVSRMTADNITTSASWFAALILLSGGIAFHGVGLNPGNSASQRA